jgi:hypothetical protein
VRPNDVMALMAICAAGAFIVKALVDSVSRYLIARESRTPPAQLTMIEARLDQLSLALEAIAIEQERQGELQRFAARVEEGRLGAGPSASLVARPTTPRPLAPYNTPH